MRPHLDYCAQAWCPYLRKDIDLLEGVQRRATKMIDGLHNLPYQERLRILNLTTLEIRRLRGDMLQVFKILHGIDIVNVDDFFVRSQSELRGHDFKLFKQRFNTNTGKHMFSNRVVDYWNSLPQDVVSSTTVLNFKVKIDQLIKKGWGCLKV